MDTGSRALEHHLLGSSLESAAHLEHRDIGVRWLKVWHVDSLGECGCGAGSRRWKDSEVSIGRRGGCARPGKHPFWLEYRADGADGSDEDRKVLGFRRGVADAVDLVSALDVDPRGARSRLACVPGDAVMVVDLDSEEAVRLWARICWGDQVDAGDVLGVARTPRGFHVWLWANSGGWTMRAARSYAQHWLDGVPGRRGFDMRVGGNVYAIWPGSPEEALWSADGRRWVAAKEWRQTLDWLRVPGVEVRERTGFVAPWRLDASGVAAVVARMGQDTGQVQVPEVLSGMDLESVRDRAWSGFRTALKRFAGMTAESGRNNRLNQIAYYRGSVLVFLGADRGVVEAEMSVAATACGCPGAKATIRSGLESGLAQLAAQG